MHVLIRCFAAVQSVLARGLHALLPPIEVVKGSYCNADPDNTREWEVRCTAFTHSLVDVPRL